MTRFGYVMVTYFSGIGIAAASLVTVPVKLLWNATASTPVGLYRLGAAGHLKRGDLVAVMPDKGLADFIVGRGYIGRGVPLLAICRGFQELNVALGGTQMKSPSR